MLVIAFYVPIANAETVKRAMFAAGAGKQGDYEQCCWQTLGEGQFFPLANAKPAIGKVNQLETVQELKVEMVCSQAAIKNVVTALKQTHPYEEPAYHVLQSILVD